MPISEDVKSGDFSFGPNTPLPPPQKKEKVSYHTPSSPVTATFLQWTLASVPKEAVIEMVYFTFLERKFKLLHLNIQHHRKALLLVLIAWSRQR